ncbi:MAG: plasmid pRiA4b ORF-3 family protein [Chromatiaceae bacterium]|nr:plasmid pRiA4b ORF-3 family protein [Chromatiaceae bacterium]
MFDEWTTSQIRLLETQDFEQRAPGTILRDFETLLSLIGDQGLPVTPSHLLAIKSLETINRSLTHPLELGLKRAMQKSYPHISGLYLLLRATGLTLIDPNLKKPRLKLDSQLMESWRSLNAAERYFALLKAWWGRATPEIICERGQGSGEIHARTLAFIERFPKTGVLTMKAPQDVEMFRYRPGFYNLALMELFGLLDIRLGSLADARAWQPERIRLTDWGKVLLGNYASFLRQPVDEEDGSTQPMRDFMVLFQPLECFESWSRTVRPHIEGWRKDLDIPELPFNPGPHLFKVSLGTDCWRRIAIGGDSSLEELAATILEAFSFDSDHLYRFSYKDRFGRDLEIHHPYSAGDFDSESADEVNVGDLPLREGMRIGFLFDFGDRWEFDIQTESVDADSLIGEPQVLERHGEAPQQYGGW